MELATWPAVVCQVAVPITTVTLGQLTAADNIISDFALMIYAIHTHIHRDWRSSAHTCHRQQPTHSFNRQYVSIQCDSLSISSSIATSSSAYEIVTICHECALVVFVATYIARVPYNRPFNPNSSQVDNSCLVLPVGMSRSRLYCSTYH